MGRETHYMHSPPPLKLKLEGKIGLWRYLATYIDLLINKMFDDASEKLLLLISGRSHQRTRLYLRRHPATRVSHV
jgi:hypothetical protein